MSSSGETPSLPVYTWDDIEKHKSAESLWVVIDGKVYDVTAFKEEVYMSKASKSYCDRPLPDLADDRSLRL